MARGLGRIGRSAGQGFSMPKHSVTEGPDRVAITACKHLAQVQSGNALRQRTIPSLNHGAAREFPSMTFTAPGTMQLTSTIPDPGALPTGGLAALYMAASDAGSIRPRWVSENITGVLGYSVEEVLAPGWWPSNLHPEDRARATTAADAQPIADPVAQEYRFANKDGSYVWVQDQRFVLQRAAGATIEVVGIWSDVTALRRARNQQRLLSRASGLCVSSLSWRDILDSAVDLLLEEHLADICIVDLVNEQGTFTRRRAVSRDASHAATLRIMVDEYAPTWNSPQPVSQALKENRPLLKRSVNDDLLAAYTCDARHLRAVSSLGMKSIMVVPMMARGRAMGALTLCSCGPEFTDADVDCAVQIGERVALAVDNGQLYERSRAAELGYRELFELSPMPAWVVARDTLAFLAVNDAAIRHYGYSRAEFLASTLYDIRPAADRETLRAFMSGERDAESRRSWRHLKKDGEVIEVEIHPRDIELYGQAACLIIIDDVTQRRRALRELTQRERQLVRASRMAQLGAWELDVATGRGSWTDELRDLYGTDPTDDPQSFDEYESLIHPEDRPIARDHITRAIEHGRNFRFEHRIIRPDGTVRHMVTTGEVDLDSAGNAIRIWGIEQDVTAFKEVQHARLESTERFHELANNIREVFFITTPGGGENLYVSPAFEEIYGRKCEEIISDPRVLMEAIHPDDRELVRAAQKNEANVHNPHAIEFRIIRPDGEVRWIRARTRTLVNVQGVPYRVVGSAEDVTERKQLEEQLRQSQKLEAIGHLAGGVAHDFNNILTAIDGYASLLLADLDAADSHRDDVAEISKGAARASALTRQLLAFSRRQVLRPQVINLNEIVQDVTAMLQRLIGEDITISTNLDPGLRLTSVDPGQVQQVLMNLVVNARDAMPAGGRLQITTRNVDLDEAYAATHSDAEVGCYSCVIVTDTGTGMDAETKARIFEPFFTTKEEKGTGLGLSTVYGIVKQSGGSISVYSEPGQGTVFRVYLQSVTSPGAREQLVSTRLEPANDTARILLVEDEASVRKLSARVLRRLGHAVTEAENGAAAIAAVKDGARFDLLVTDLVMPGINGAETAEQIKKLQPLLPVLYTSGYTDDVILQRGILKEGFELLEKPFSPTALAEKVAELLCVR